MSMGTGVPFRELARGIGQRHGGTFVYAPFGRM